jgi:hypothetical protein
MASIKDLKRMCKNMTCKDCQLSGSGVADCWMYTLPDSYPDEDIDAIVDKWVEEHPATKESAKEHGFETEGHHVKTYAMDFFEKFPNAYVDRYKTPKVCRVIIYGNNCPKECHIVSSCYDCWNMEIKEQ